MIVCYTLQTPLYHSCGNQSASVFWSFTVLTWMHDKRELV